ncbi:MAG: hypothetical protein A7316_01725 [Candidatus Altiarchaeales archaeon WOR_SM1_86-2]|nr:MAG: hypothetical protein A7316_01725 [Candidatus Altiarchaeales archaeon WOR_SM1_86-2]
MKFSKSFTVKGDIGKVFELTKEHMSNMKFQIVNQNTPNFISLKRGSRLGSLTSSETENAETELSITLKQKGGEVNILCDYDVRWYRVQWFTASDKSTLESEVEELKYFLVTTIEEKPKRDPGHEKELAERKRKLEDQRRRLKELEEEGYGGDEEFKELKRLIEKEERKLPDEYR